MPNEIEIVVKGVDKSGPAKSAIDDIAAHAKRKGKEAGESLGDGIWKGADGRLRDARGRFVSTGASLGGSLMQGITGVVGKGGPQLTAALGAIGAAAAPALGAAVTAGVIGAVGAGGILGGLALLKNDARIKVVGQQLSENLLGGLRQSAEPLIAPLLDVMGQVEIRFARTIGSFDKIFANAAKGLDSFIGPALNGFENLIDAFGDLSPAIEPVMAAFGNLSETVLDAVASGLRSLSDNGTEAAAAIDAIGKTINLAADFAFGFINALTEVYGWSLRLRSALGDDGATEALREYSREADDAGESSDELGGSYSELADEAENLEEAILGAVEAERKQKDLNLSAAEANLAYRDTVKEVAEAIDKKTGVSRDEEEQILALARATNRQIESMEASKAPAEEVARLSADAEREFRKQAKAAGYSASEIDKMVRELLAVPAETTADMYLRGVNEAIADARRLKEYLRRIPDEDVRVAIRVTGASAARAAANIGKQYAQAHGGITGVNAGTAATGGARGDWTWVGEQGAELVKLPFGSTVYPAGQSKRMADQARGLDGGIAGATGGGIRAIEVRPAPGVRWDSMMRALIEGIQFMVRTEGRGDVNYLAGG